MIGISSDLKLMYRCEGQHAQEKFPQYYFEVAFKCLSVDSKREAPVSSTCKNTEMDKNEVCK